MYNDIIKENALKYNIEIELLTALITTESNFNQWAFRYEADYSYLYKVEDCAKMLGCKCDTVLVLQKSSFGICQIMGAVYYELKGTNWATILFQPEVNIKFACEHLSNLIKKQYLSGAKDIYAAYNAGSVRHMKNGSLVNQKNVDRFMKHYNKIKNL